MVAAIAVAATFALAPAVFAAERAMIGTPSHGLFEFPVVVARRLHLNLAQATEEGRLGFSSQATTDKVGRLGDYQCRNDKLEVPALEGCQRRGVIVVV